MQPTELRDLVREELLAFAWNEWAQMGLSGHMDQQETRAMDPEAFLLFTIEVARRDPRLFDELLDWVATNGNLLSPNRIKHLRSRHGGEVELVDAVLAWANAANPGLRWRTPASTRPEMTDVFASDVAAFSSRTDPTFEAHGFRRPPVKRSHKSEPPDTHKPINFAFRLRALFGTGTRAEVVRILLTSEQRSLNVAHVAQEAAFAKRNVNETLLALLRAGVVEARWSGNERFFTLDRNRWTQLFGTGGIGDHLPQAAPWIWLLRASTAVYRWLDQIDPQWSPYMVASRARELTDSIAGDAERAGIHVKSEPRASGEAYWPRFEALVQDLLKLTRVGAEPAGKERSSARESEARER